MTTRQAAGEQLRAGAIWVLLLLAPCIAHAQGGQPSNPWAVSPGPATAHDQQSAFTQGYLRGFEQGYRRGAEQRPNGNPEVAHTGPGAGGGPVRSDWNFAPGGINSNGIVTGTAPAVPPLVVQPTAPPAAMGNASAPGIPGLPDAATRSPAHRWGEYPPMPGQMQQAIPMLPQQQQQLQPGPTLAERHYPYTRSVTPYGTQAPAYPYGTQPPHAAYGVQPPYAPQPFPYAGAPSTFTNPYAGLAGPWGMGAAPYGVPGIPPW